MFKLENFSLVKRMQIVAFMGIIGMFLLLALYWYLETSGVAADKFWWIAVSFTVIGSVVLYLAAVYIGNFGAKNEANSMVAGIQNIKKGI